MSSKLIIVADLQRFKFFVTKVDPLGREAVELMEGSESLDIHQRLSEKVSDQQGNFEGAGASGTGGNHDIGVGAKGSGEDHNIRLEEERRRIKDIAEQINKTIEQQAVRSWYFAAPKAINNKIVELLNPAVKMTMIMNLHSDLTKIPDDQLLEHFIK
ncbi:MAG: host attachment protein [Campylobacterales bacterium]|nr:host attachment protein [Campylobacterales bacterium]